MIVALDGPAGAGKSSVAQAVARRLGFQYVDTGAIYRTLTLLAKDAGKGFDDAPALAAIAAGLRLEFRMTESVNQVWVSADGGALRDVTTLIRSVDISRGTSQISALPDVRAALLDLQRRLGSAADCVLEGRDIGTVVFPDAKVKVFLTASPEERAQRRWKQWHDAAADPSSVPSVETIAAEIRDRDDRDSNRAIAPLKPASDAIDLDTTGLTFDEVVAAVVAIVVERQNVRH